MNSRNRFYNNYTIASILSTRYLVNELDATSELTLLSNVQSVLYSRGPGLLSTSPQGRSRRIGNDRKEISEGVVWGLQDSTQVERWVVM